MSEIKINDALWYVPNERNAPAFEVFVSKIGRAWITIEREVQGTRYPAGRVAKDTLTPDSGGYHSRAQCYVNREAWEADCARAEAWAELAKIIRETWRAPEHLTAAEIKAMTARVRAAGMQ